MSSQTATHPFQITLNQSGKKFFRNWIFRNLSIELSVPEKIVVLGPNGSGKSTLLHVLSGQLSLSEGSVKYINSVPLEASAVFKHISIAAPYLDLIEDFTMEEIIRFHFQFKKAVNNFSVNEIVGLTELEGSKDKVFKYFSSGMKQRVKLCLAILSDVNMVLLDEPLSNLDKNGVLWYKKLVSEYLKARLVVVCSNHDLNEYEFCDKEVDIMKYK
jgi:ABC-type multidrug transport system ATPase subunit